MRARVLLLLLCFCVAGMLSSCYDDDCHYHSHGGFWHCHDDHHHSDHVHHSSQVFLLITDHPIDDVDAFFVTITEVTFIEEEAGPMSVYRSDAGRRIDLLSLRGSRSTRLYDLLAIQELPPGVYGSIRLTVRDPALILSSGEVLDGSEIDLAGNGSIEIGLPEPVLLGPDETVYVVLDFDVSSSLTSKENSEGFGRGIIRPLILADVLYDDIEDEILTPTDLRGRLAQRDPETGLFTLELSEERGALDFRLSEEAEILDRYLNPASVNALTLGSDVRVRGYLTAAGQLDAESVALEPVPSLKETRLDETRLDETRGHDGHAARLPRGSESDGAVSVARPATPVRGTVSRVAPGHQALVLHVDGSPRTIEISPDTTIVLVEISEEGLWQTSIPIREVDIGANVVVHGDVGLPVRLVVVTTGE